MTKTVLGGLTPSKLKGSAPNSNGLKKYTIASGYASDIFKGTPVKLGTGGTVEVADTSNRVLGSLAGIEYVDARGVVVDSAYFASGTTAPAGTEIVALVHDNPDQLFLIESDEALAQTNVGEIFTLANIGSGSTINGRSTAKLDGSSTPANEAAATVRIVGKYDGVENELTDADAIVEVELVNPGIGATS